MSPVPIVPRPNSELTPRLDLISNSSRLLVLGTSLATYSAFRLVKQAREQGKEVLIISLGPSRADPLEGVQKMERKAGDVLRVFLDETLKYVDVSCTTHRRRYEVS
jgi:NAD-dependent SIR2 family protein deacetylase